jgi:uncharacterized caspase-like protein
MRLFRFFVLCAVCLGCASPAWAVRRVALVLGNGGYQHVMKLPNPANDATAIADMLKAAGFEVIRGTDLSRDQMVGKVSEFADALKNGADAAVIFYAGHGMQIAGKNYLVPIDANLRTTYDVKANAIDADDVVDSASNAKVKLVLLDACRDNPFAEQLAKGDAKSRSAASNSGLAAMQSAEGTLISFATSPGSTALDGQGDHSPFTRALLDNLVKPGVEINDAMTSVRAEVQTTTDKQQQPWENTNLTGKFFLVEPAAPTAATTDAPAISQVSPAGVDATQAAVIETTIWQSAEKSGHRDEYELYLSKYPKGRGLYSELAELRLAEITKAATTATPTPSASPQVASLDAARAAVDDPDQTAENTLGLDVGKWKDVQKKLISLGFSTGGNDGAPGPGTRKAINLWQTAHGYHPSGYLNQAELSALTLEQVKRSAKPTAPVRQTASGQHSTGGGYGGNSYGGNSYGAAPQGGGYGNAAGAMMMNAFGAGLGAAVGCKLTHCY